MLLSLYRAFAGRKAVGRTVATGLLLSLSGLRAEFLPPPSEPFANQAATVPATTTAFELTAESGTYALTGTDATPQYNRLVVADGTTYAVTGTDATPQYNRLVVASGGVYALSGTAATPTYNRLVVASGGTYSLAGTAATPKYNRLVVASGGTYILSGTAATPAFNRLVTASGGTYALSGAAATLIDKRILIASGGSYVLTGSAATPKYNRLVIASGGLYSLSGSPTTFPRTTGNTGGGGGYAYGYRTSPWHSLADVHKGPDIVSRSIKAKRKGQTAFEHIDPVQRAKQGFEQIRVTKKIPPLPAAVRSKHDRAADDLIAKTRPPKKKK